MENPSSEDSPSPCPQGEGAGGWGSAETSDEPKNKNRRGLRNGERVTQAQRTKRARNLRASMGVSERFLWMWLRKERTGFRFRRQHPVDKFTLDYFCPEAMVNIEVDGEQHVATREQDAIRDCVLRGLGIEVLRVPSLDLFDDSPKLSFWLQRIVELCEERTGRKGQIPEFW